MYKILLENIEYYFHKYDMEKCDPYGAENISRKILIQTRASHSISVQS